MSHNTQKYDIAIIGAGLSGLYLADCLVSQRGQRWAASGLGVFEADTRVGGRVLSAIDPASGYGFDLGPSWLWPEEQPLVAQLVERFRLPLIPQWQEGNALFQLTPDAPAQPYRDQRNYSGAYRIQGGTHQLVEALSASLMAYVRTGHRLLELRDQGPTVRLTLQQGEGENRVHVEANQVVLALPPRISAERIQFAPALSARLLDVLLATPTWMAGQAKVSVCYSSAFWRAQGYSGTVMTNAPGTVLAEVFDACGAAGKRPSLGAFMSLPPAVRERRRLDLPAAVVEQLCSLFGASAAQPLALHIKDWSIHKDIATAGDAAPLYSHPRYGHRWLHLDHWNDKVFFCGSETSAVAGGYMEGALQSAGRVCSALGLSRTAEFDYA